MWIIVWCNFNYCTSSLCTGTAYRCCCKLRPPAAWLQQGIVLQRAELLRTAHHIQMHLPADVHSIQAEPRARHLGKRHIKLHMQQCASIPRGWCEPHAHGNGSLLAACSSYTQQHIGKTAARQLHTHVPKCCCMVRTEMSQSPCMLWLSAAAPSVQLTLMSMCAPLEVSTTSSCVA
jgi:hypothetical protein